MKAKKESPPQPKDELSQRLHDSLRKQRPKTGRIVAGVLALAVAGLGFMIWYFYPRPAPPPLYPVAFDQLGVQGEEITLRGRLAPAPDEVQSVSLLELDLTFEESKLLKPGESAKQITVKTDAAGTATCSWSFLREATRGDFLVRRLGTRDNPGSDDRGHVFFWPRESKVVVVQVEGALARPPTGWAKDNVHDIPAAPGASKALRALEAAKYRIAYLALDAGEPLVYQKMRGWVANQSVPGADGFPAGPVLSETSSGEGEARWRETVASFKRRFSGPIVAVASTHEAARGMLAAGVETYVLGPGNELSPEIHRAANWEEIGKRVGAKEEK